MAETFIPPSDDWTETDRRIEEKKKVLTAEQVEVDNEWQSEIDTLMGRAADPGLSFECVDLSTGNVVLPIMGSDNKPRAPDGAMKMRTGYSVMEQKEVSALIDRSNTLVLKIADIAAQTNPDIDPGFVMFETNKLAGELGQITRRLYTLFTVNPIITELWLLDNEDKWRMENLAVLIARYRQRQVEMSAMLGKICGKRNRRNVGGVSPVAKSDVGRVGPAQR